MLISITRKTSKLGYRVEIKANGILVGHYNNVEHTITGFDFMEGITIKRGTRKATAEAFNDAYLKRIANIRRNI